MTVQIFDDLVPQSLADRLEEGFLHDDTSWNFQLGCGEFLGIEYSDANVKDTPQMYHSLVSDNVPKSTLTTMSMCILFFLEHKVGIFPAYVKRVKANLLFAQGHSSTQYHPPHRDTLEKESLSLVYYVHDSDGPTRFFDLSGNIVQTVEPRKGRAVLFPSSILHASSCPINNKYRIVINFVFNPK